MKKRDQGTSGVGVMASSCNGGLHSAELCSAVLADLKTLVGEELKVNLELRINIFDVHMPVALIPANKCGARANC